MVVVFVVTVLLKDGDHVPETPLVETDGNVKAVPEQIEVGKVKAGFNFDEAIVILSAFIEPINSGVEELDDV